MAMVRRVLTGENPKARKVMLKADWIEEYFPDDYSNEEIENIILKLLKEWKKKGGGR